jgi:uncharacterized FlaG/YvyC family protein
MKVQGIFDTVMVPEAERVRPVPQGIDGKPKEKSGPVVPAKPPLPPSQDYSKILERIAEAIRQYVQYHRTSVDITVDAELQQIVSRVIDEDSGKVIRQYPEDAALAVMKHLKELRGLLLNRKG